jgi:receptor expression-enhancing protein 5/6
MNGRLTYWVVFGGFNFLESFIDVILHFLPMYYTFKTLAIVWLMLPQTQVSFISFLEIRAES